MLYVRPSCVLARLCRRGRALLVVYELGSMPAAADAITYTKCSFHDIYVQICPLLCVLLYADVLFAADERPYDCSG